MSESLAPSARIDAIHALRGVASLSVCLMHVTTATTHAAPSILAWLAHFGAYGVPVFFVISGFVVPLSLLGRNYTIRRFPHFIARRMIRLDPPYLVALLLALVLALRITPFPFSAADVVLHLGYLNGLTGHKWGLTTFWTLGIEFQFYVLVGLAMAFLLPRAGHLSGPAQLGLLLAGFVTLGVVKMGLHQVWTDAEFPMLWILYKADFVLGIAALVVRRQAMRWWWMIGFGAVVLTMDGWQSLESGVIRLGTAVVIAAVPATFDWMRRPPGILIAGLGTISYSLYVTHLLVTGRLTSRFGAGWSMVAAELVICLAVAAGFYFLIEAPAWRLSRRIRL